MVAMTVDELQAFLDEHFPHHTGRVEAVGRLSARMRLPVGDEHLRPGGTVSSVVPRRNALRSLTAL
jgi:acyl-coenzyme A thioesterase PaaI-like protein